MYLIQSLTIMIRACTYIALPNISFKKITKISIIMEPKEKIHKKFHTNKALEETSNKIQLVQRKIHEKIKPYRSLSKFHKYLSSY